MFDEMDKSGQEFTQDLKSGAKSAGNTAVKGIKAVGKRIKKGPNAVAKMLKTIVKAIAKAISFIIMKLIALGPVVLAIVLAVGIFLGAVYVWFQGDRGTSAARSLNIDDENITEINDGTGAVTAIALSENQAIIDAYYKYMACQSYTKYYNGEEFTFKDTTEDFAGLMDYYSAEKDYFLSHNFIAMADEILHDNEFNYPEHIVMPVKYEITTSEESGETIAQTVPLDKDGSISKEDIKNTGLGSILTYKQDIKDDYLDVKISKFQVDFDRITSFPDGGSTVEHLETYDISGVDSNGRALSSSELQSIIDERKEEHEEDCAENQSISVHQPNIQQFAGEADISRTVNGVETKFKINHMVQPVYGRDKDIDKTTFNSSALKDFSNDANGLYPINIPLITSAATFSGNIEYTYLDTVDYVELADGSADVLYEPVKNYSYTLNCCLGSSDSPAKFTAVKTGYRVTKVPVPNTKTPDPDVVAKSEEASIKRDRPIGEFSGNPWGYEYFDMYAEHYCVDVPVDIGDKNDFVKRIKKDEDAFAVLKQLGLLREYHADGSLSAIGEYTASDEELLAHLIHNEAGNNKLDELLVASVALNRVKSPYFDEDTLYDVIHAPGQYDLRARFEEEPTPRQWESARQCLSGEFTIPENIVGQSARAQFDGDWFVNLNNVNGGHSEYAHHYSYKGSAPSEVDRFGRTALSLDEMKALAERLDTEVSDVTGPLPSDDPSTPVKSDNETIYLISPFNVIEATNIFHKVAKPSEGFFGDLLSKILSTDDFFSIIRRIKPDGKQNDPNNTEPVEMEHFSNYHINEKDVRRIIYQAVTLDECCTYQEAKTSYEHRYSDFLFMGQRPEEVIAAVISYTGSILPGWLSPTEIACTPAATMAGVSGKGAKLTSMKGEVLQALSDGQVVRSNGRSIEIMYEAVDGTVYTSIYSEVENTLAEGTKVSKGDTVATVGESGAFIFEFKNETEYLLPMTMFYQMVYSGGGSDVVEIAMNEYYACKANPYAFDTVKYERAINGTNLYHAWCAYFASWCGRQVYPNQWFVSGGCSTITHHFKDGSPELQAMWENSPSHGGSYVPKAGDQILFDFKPEDEYIASHTGIVVGVEGNKVVTIEGNTTATGGVKTPSHNCVWMKYRDINSSTIIGYVKYSELSVEP